MTRDEELFEKISDRVAQAKGDCAILLISRIVEALQAKGIPIDDMQELCSSVVSGQQNDPAAEYALADFKYPDSYSAAQNAKAAAWRLMLEDEKQDQASPAERP